MTNVNVGLVPDDGTGDVLRNAFIITNNNFIEIFAALDSSMLGVNMSISTLNARMDILESTSSSQSIDITSINNSIMALNTAISNQNLAMNTMNAIMASQSADIANIYQIIQNL